MTADAPPLEYLVRTDGPRLAYRRLAARPVAAGRTPAGEPAGGDAPRPGIVFLHGLLSDMEGTKALALEAHCRARGLAMLRFDYRGHGRSGGAPEDGTLSRWLDDVLAALDALTRGPQVLVGSSLGGWLMTLAAVARPERVAGLVGVAVALDFTKRLREEIGAEGRLAIERDGVYRMPSAYGSAGYPITRALLEDGAARCQLDGRIAYRGPVRLLHGQADADVPWRNSLAAATALDSTDVAVELVKDGDHRLSRRQDLERLCRAVDEVVARAGDRG